MEQCYVSVIYPVSFDLVSAVKSKLFKNKEIEQILNKKRLTNTDIKKLREFIFKVSDYILKTTTIKPLIHASNLSELID